MVPGRRLDAFQGDACCYTGARRLGIVIVLVAGVLVALANLRTVYRATNAVAQTNDVAHLEALLASLIDAETGERGFIITRLTRPLIATNRGVQLGSV